MMAGEGSTRIGGLDLSAGYGNARFAAVLERDRAQLGVDEVLARWLMMEQVLAAGHDHGLDVHDYQGPQHVRTLMDWATPFDFPDWFLAPDDELVRASTVRDTAVLERLDLPPTDLDLAHLGRYNAQDHRLARFYPVPERQRPRVQLDFGPGHGRLANLALRPGQGVETLVAVEGIVGPYMAQRAYYAGLGLRVADYVDADDPDAFDVAALAPEHDVIHLPTWRLDLVPDDTVDLVTCVQVLRELPRDLVWYALEQFARVVRPGGALYVRDHQQGHNPNGLPLDDLVEAHGFRLEFAPHVIDRVDVHGLPRMWRRHDPAAYDDHR